MLDVQVNPQSVDTTLAYMDRVKQAIFAGVRAGMAEGMDILAGNTVAEMHAAGIQNRTGALEKNILASPQIIETAEFIRGRVSAKAVVKAKGGERYLNNLGNILNRGFHDPALKSPVHQFTAADGETLYRRGHRAFDVKPHPFFRQAMAVSESPIMEAIRSRVAAAIEETKA